MVLEFTGVRMVRGGARTSMTAYAGANPPLYMFTLFALHLEIGLRLFLHLLNLSSRRYHP
jgi:hypothetical protein